jgi:neurotransmitter:Na+ symporter, NSS family
MTRENWGTRVGFILAAAGSAIGLGNIWRFPGVAYENGGGAFLLPYLIALLTAGIPLLILEFTIGRRYRGAAPVAFRRLNKNLEFVGWWQVAICIIIAAYYAVIIAWAAAYTYYALGRAWGDDTVGFLLTDFLGYMDAEGQTVAIFDFGTWIPNITIILIAIWLLVLVVIGAGVRRGIETANKVFIPMLVLMFGVLVVQALTLEGATTGLNAFFTPNWSELTNGTVWVSAYGQIFFSLSIGFGIMVTYASYLKRKSDITTSALTVGFANSSFELFAGIGVFSVLGYMAVQAGTPVEEQVGSGVILAFAAFPAIINTLPYAAGLFGLLFFASLVVAGLSSLISIVQVPVAAVEDRFGVSRGKATAFVGGGTALASVALFPTANGLELLDHADTFINRLGIAAAALVSIVAVVWVAFKWQQLRDDANRTSTFKIGYLWVACLGVVTPLILGWMLFIEFIPELIRNEAEVPTSTLVYGWSIAIGALLFGLVMGILLRQKSAPRDAEAAEDLAASESGEEVSK